MLELFGGGILGGVFGGVFRLAPEIIKFFDRKSERQHELAMFDRQCELEAARGQQRLAEIGAQHDADVDTGVIAAFKSAIDQQTQMTVAAGGWVAALSASVRPVITYWILAMWSFVHAWYAYQGYASGLDATEVFDRIMSADFAALVSGTINYWMLDRSLTKRGLA